MKIKSNSHDKYLEAWGVAERGVVEIFRAHNSNLEDDVTHSVGR